MPNLPRPRSVRPRRAAPSSSQRGVSLLEVLVAFLIFSFGMLGLAGLQVRTLSYSQSSLFRSQATALTDDVLDRMRADREEAKKTSGNWVTDLETSAATAAATNEDLGDWKSEVEGLLPRGKASISVETNGDVTVEITWLDSRTEAATSDSDDSNLSQTFTTVTRL